MDEKLITLTQVKNNTSMSLFLSFIKKRGSMVIFVVLWIFAAIFVRNFATPSNMILIVKQAAIPVIACLGMTMVLTTGGIDLSLGYLIGLSSVIIGICVKIIGMPAIPAIIITLAVAAVVGLCNGILVQVVKVPAFIATLGMGYIIYGIAEIIGKGSAYNKMPADLVALGKTDVLGLPIYVFISLGVIVICYILLHKSVFGRSLSAFGFNEKASRLSGIKTGKINIATYVICALFAAIAGILLTIRVDCAQATLGGGGYTFEIVTAAIVGGASLFGGVSTVIGSVFGVLIIKLIENSINLLGVSYHLYQAFMGAVILLAIIFENIKNRRL